MQMVRTARSLASRIGDGVRPESLQLRCPTDVHSAAKSAAEKLGARHQTLRKNEGERKRPKGGGEDGYCGRKSEVNGGGDARLRR